MVEHDESRPGWDEEVALDLMGSLVLVGITHLSHDEKVIRQEQFFGRVVVANQREGICLELEGSRDGEHYWLPPTIEPYERAKPGLYTLRSTNEEVSDPDYLITWVLTEPPPNWRPEENEEDRGDGGTLN